jgi:YD repeat-containing protein
MRLTYSNRMFYALLVGSGFGEVAGAFCPRAACPSSEAGFTRQTLTSFNTGSAYLAPSVHLLDLPTAIVVDDVNGTTDSKRQLFYDEQTVQAEPGITGIDGSTPTARGNVTTDQQWWDVNNTYPANHYTYDVAGNVLTDKDPNGNKTSFGYADSSNAYAHPTLITNAKGQQSSAGYDYSTGKPTSTTDVDGVTTQYSYSGDPSRSIDGDSPGRGRRSERRQRHDLRVSNQHPSSPI